MTLVAGVSSTWDAFVVADSRLSWEHATAAHRADVCQKIVLANAWSIVGFAGDLCLARHLVQGVVNRLRATQHSDPGWLLSEDELRDYIAEGVTEHGRLGPEHKRCQRKFSALLITWMDWSRSILAANEKEPSPSFVPGTEVLAIHVQMPRITIHRTRLGLDVIGSGRKIAQMMQSEAHRMLISYGRYDMDSDIAEAHRALIGTQVIRDLLREKGGDTGVGGLYQVATLSKEKVRTVPYFYLAEVEPGYRTYVAMRTENGEWVQEHRPTGTVVKIMSPFTAFDTLRLGKVFDPSITLIRDSPGVIPARQSELVFCLYDPDNVPAPIRESWGDEPLAPLSWGPDFATADTPTIDTD